MPSPSAFYPRDHFAQRASERGFTLAQAESCVCFPDKKRRQGRGEEGGFKEVFQKAFEDRTLFVVAEVKGADCWLITGYWQ
jgi:Domain of unknown function (DUF4258)